MNYTNKKGKSSFPDPLASTEAKNTKEYGIEYAKAIESQWGKMGATSSLFGRRNLIFDRSRDYANGTQSTDIYKKLLRSLNPNDGDGSLMNLDYTPVPVLPKFVRVVVNKILSRSPYPNLEAIDPLSSSEKNRKKRKIELQIQQKEQLMKLKQSTGVVFDIDPDQLPDSEEESEIFMGTNTKTDAEIAAQIGTNLTLSWNNFIDGTFRRCVNDLVALGMAVVKRSNDPNQGIKTEYVDPARFIHSYTEDPNFEDLIYAGHVKTISIQELKRLAGHELNEDDFKKIAESAQNSYGNDSASLHKSSYNKSRMRQEYGYDEYMVDVLDFEFISVDCIHFEEKENRFGNVNFFMKGFDYEPKQGSVYQRTPHKMEIATVYSGSYIMGAGKIFNYGMSKNIPKNIHDLTRCTLGS